MQLLSLPPYLPPSELFQPGSGGEKIIFKSCLDFFLKRCICHTALKWVGVYLNVLQTQLLCVQSNPQLLTLPQVLCVFGVSQSLGRVEGPYNSYHYLYDASEAVQLWPFWARCQLYSGWYARLFAFHATLFCDMLDIYFWHILVNFLNLKVLTHISTTSHKWQLYCDLNVLYN